MSLGLFQNVYWRVVAVIAAALLAMFAFSHFSQSRVLIAARKADLQQEANWFARHVGFKASYEQIARAWRSMHDGVRLQILDTDGKIIADSFDGHRHQEAGDTIYVQAPLAKDPNKATLLLSRGGMGPNPVSVQMSLLLTTLLLVVLAATLILPLTRRLADTFTRLSALAASVADGRFGDTLPERGDREVISLIASFNKMSRNLQAAEARNRSLLVEVSHEFRSPLGRIAALIDTMKRHPDEAGELCDIIRRELALLDRITGDALAAARFEPEPPELNMRAVEPRGWIDDAFQRLAKPVREAGAAIRLSNAVSSGTVEVDPDRLMQALGNLLDNALKAVRGRPGPLIGLEARWESPELVIRVIDNGPGIAPHDRPLVFNRFFRGENAPEGTGLGLGIARDLVEAHGGRLNLHEAEPQGTIAEIRLPLQKR